jgi:CBS domain-containing protein
MALLESHTALHGFRTCYLDNISGLPVIDSNGKVVANLSASDLRGMSAARVPTINLPVFEFLETVPRRNQDLKADQIRTISKTATVEQAINLLVKSKLHRLWIVEDEELYGVVSMTDILRLFTSLN